MQRVTRSTAAVALPAPPAGAGSPGFFTGGNPGTGTPATVPGFEWFNGVQEELMYVIEQAGLTGSATDHTKLRQAIQALVAAGTVPTGAIVTFPATAAPAGWLKANGALLSRTTYAGLWAFAQASGNIVIDSTWVTSRPGSFSFGDGSTTFRIPDLRGLFMRGFHDGSGSYESNTGMFIGQYRDDQNKAHTHRTDGADGGSQHASRLGSDGPFDFVSTDYSVNDMAFITGSITGSSGGAETYPRHILELFCIKY
ncbi:MAG: phage tail protein [Pseudomonadota bacterium]